MRKYFYTFTHLRAIRVFVVIWLQNGELLSMYSVDKCIYTDEHCNPHKLRIEFKGNDTMHISQVMK